MIDVKIKLMDGATMPSYANDGDSGVDLYPKEYVWNFHKDMNYK